MKKVFWWIAAVSVGAAISARAGVDVNLNLVAWHGVGNNVISYPSSDVSTAHETVISAEIIMRYGDTGPTFKTFCLSPAGSLGSGIYDLMSFHDAAPGRNPDQWVPDGINAAAYIFNHYNQLSDNPDVAAATQLAIWMSLYDTVVTGGNVSFGGGKFVIEQFGSDQVKAAYNVILNGLTNLKKADIEGVQGMIYRPQSSGGQDLITAVPEPSTVVSGLGALIFLSIAGLKKRI